METNTNQNENKQPEQASYKGCLIYVLIIIGFIAAAVAVKYFLF